MKPILRDPSDGQGLLTVEGKVLLAMLFVLPGCGPLVGEIVASGLSGSPWLHDSRWFFTEELLSLGIVWSVFATPIAIFVIVRHGRSVPTAWRRTAWVLVAASMWGILKLIGMLVGVSLMQS